jgi:glutamate dehydrogenase/leucine dehydrogenase
MQLLGHLHLQRKNKDKNIGGKSLLILGNWEVYKYIKQFCVRLGAKLVVMQTYYKLLI